MSGINIYEPSEPLFRRQLAVFLGGVGADSGSGGFTSLKLEPITTAAKEALANAAGLVVYDSDLGKLCVNTGAGWETVTSS